MIQILSPTSENIDKIRSLNNKYLVSRLEEKEKHSGFIRIGYSSEHVQKIIDSKEIVIASDDNKVIGYYLIGRKSDNAALDYQMDKCLTIDSISSDKIGYGCQVCIDCQ
jgi:hypothetical protein